MSQRAKKSLHPHRRCKWGTKNQSWITQELQMGGCKCNCKKKSLRCPSQRDEEPRLEGQKAAWGLRAALCPPLMLSIWLQNQQCCFQALENNISSDSLLSKYLTSRKGEEWSLCLLKSSEFCNLLFGRTKAASFATRKPHFRIKQQWRVFWSTVYGAASYEALRGRCFCDV